MSRGHERGIVFSHVQGSTKVQVRKLRRAVLHPSRRDGSHQESELTLSDAE